MTYDYDAPRLATIDARPMDHRLNRRSVVLGGAGVGLGVAGAATLVRIGRAAQDDSATPVASPSSTGDATPGIVSAANAFLATLSDDERDAVLFDFDDTAQRQRWSNFPEGLFERDGLMWGDLSTETQDAWLALMQVTLSAEGYARVQAEWSADDALANGQGGSQGAGGAGTPPAGAMGGRFGDGGTPPAGGMGGGPGGAGGTPPAGGMGGGAGGMAYGRQYYWVAIIGEPSETEPWQWQWGGHHVTVNATVVGPDVTLNPSFIGVQPATYTDADGNTVRPLGDIEDEAFALVNSLDADQLAQAVLGDTYVDLVLGPGEDGRTLQAEGLACADMTDGQRAAVLHLLDHYTGLVNDEDAASRQAEVEDGLDATYFAWYGPIEAGSSSYFRLAGPRIVVEYSPQSMGGNAADHIHGIYRDPENDYGALLTGVTLTS